MNNKEKRDDLIKQLWLTLHNISEDHLFNNIPMSPEDLELWGVISQHSSFKKKLQAAFNPQFDPKEN